MILVVVSSSLFSEQGTRNFLQTVQKTMTEYAMVQPGDKVLVALSGGPDSVALLRTLIALQSDLGIQKIGAVHLNHMLRKEGARKDQEFAQQLAEKYKIPFFTQNINVKELAAAQKISIETAGRKARYDFFCDLMQSHSFTRTATGHTKDDNIEQILMALIRGAGSRGMKGIAPVRNQNIIRPLINITKSQITEFLDRIHQPFVIDLSNEDPSFLRNRIRNQLIPMLEKEYNPNIRETLGRNAALFQEDESFWEHLVTTTFPKCLVSSNTNKIQLDIKSLTEIPPCLTNRILRQALSRIKTDLYRISFTHIMDIRDLMTKSPSGKCLDLPDQIRVYKEKQVLIIKKEKIPLRKLGRQKTPSLLKKTREDNK